MSLDLVTGGTGFLGSHLADRLLAAGRRVRLLARSGEPPEHGAQGAEVVRGDLTDPASLQAALAGVGRVYHCAAVLGPAGTPAERYHQVNVEGTRALMEAARAAGASRVVCVSSVAVLGPVGPTPADETAPYAPTDIYEETKAEAEGIALAAASDGLEVVVARPAWVYGPRDDRTLKLIRRISSGRMVMVGDGSTLNSPVYVTDVADGLLLCGAVEGISGGIYHLAGAYPSSVAEMIQAIARAAEAEPPKVRLPALPMTAAAWICEVLFGLLGREAPLDRRKLGFFLKPRVYSIDKARSELGYAPEVRLDEGLQKAVAWYREKGKL